MHRHYVTCSLHAAAVPKPLLDSFLAVRPTWHGACTNTHSAFDVLLCPLTSLIIAAGGVPDMARRSHEHTLAALRAAGVDDQRFLTAETLIKASRRAGAGLRCYKACRAPSSPCTLHTIRSCMPELQSRPPRLYGCVYHACPAHIQLRANHFLCVCRCWRPACPRRGCCGARARAPSRPTTTSEQAGRGRRHAP